MKITADLSCRVYKLLLIAYPSAFRREYGHEMQQVFRDCYRDEVRRNQVPRYWLRTLVDLVLTATKEHSEELRKDHTIMSTREIVSLVGCTAIIVIAFALLSYGRAHEVASILAFGRVLDAIVTTGIIGNLIIFLLVKTTRWHSLRIALWTFVVVHAIPLIVLAVIGPRIEAQFRLAPIMVAYFLSFLFWFGLHWAWDLSNRQLVKS